MANRCVFSVLGSDPVSFVVSLLFLVAKRKSGRGICGSSCSLSFRFCLFVVLVDLPSQGTTVFLAEFLIQFTCLYQFQDQALERHRPYQRKKRLARKQPAEKGFQHWGTVRPFEMRLMTRTSQWDEKL